MENKEKLNLKHLKKKEEMFKLIKNIKANELGGMYTVKQTNLKDIPKKVSEHHVFDEDKSVKWNRKEIERLNREREKDIQYNQDLINKKYELFLKDLEFVIKNTTKNNNKESKRIIAYLLQKYKGQNKYLLLDGALSLIELLMDLEYMDEK